VDWTEVSGVQLPFAVRVDLRLEGIDPVRVGARVGDVIGNHNIIRRRAIQNQPHAIYFSHRSPVDVEVLRNESGIHENNKHTQKGRDSSISSTNLPFPASLSSWASMECPGK
jgi:hypothetical protein